jgi:hypothetical protein
MKCMITFAVSLNCHTWRVIILSRMLSMYVYAPGSLQMDTGIGCNERTPHSDRRDTRGHLESDDNEHAKARAEFPPGFSKQVRKWLLATLLRFCLTSS